MKLRLFVPDAFSIPQHHPVRALLVDVSRWAVVLLCLLLVPKLAELPATEVGPVEAQGPGTTSLWLYSKGVMP